MGHHKEKDDESSSTHKEGGVRSGRVLRYHVNSDKFAGIAAESSSRTAAEASYTVLAAPAANLETSGAGGTGSGMPGGATGCCCRSSLPCQSATEFQCRTRRVWVPDRRSGPIACRRTGEEAGRGLRTAAGAGEAGMLLPT